MCEATSGGKDGWVGEKYHRHLDRLALADNPDSSAPLKKLPGMLSTNAMNLEGMVGAIVTIVCEATSGGKDGWEGGKYHRARCDADKR